MNKEIYFDNSSTTKVSKKSIDKMLEIMENTYYNADSLYYNGFKAKKEVELARSTIAKAINASSSEIYFTSGGTESNNLAIFGTAIAKQNRGKKIITSQIEHASVLNCFKELEKIGFEVVYLPVNKNSEISKQNLYDNIDKNTTLISLMKVNNETGAILPVEDIKKIIKEKNSNAVLHTDAVQAFGKIEIDVKKLNIDIMSLSGHKVFAPVGVGALYIKNGVNIKARNFGGKQEKNLRSGTLATQLIGAFGAAVSEFDINSRNIVKSLHEYTLRKLLTIPEVVINSPKNAAYGIINFSTGVIKSETMLHFLEDKGIMVSSGSTCSKGKQSHVLKVMGLDKKLIDSAIRVSLCKNNTKEEIDYFIENLKLGIKNLIRI